MSKAREIRTAQKILDKFDELSESPERFGRYLSGRKINILARYLVPVLNAIGEKAQSDINWARLYEKIVSETDLTVGEKQEAIAVETALEYLRDIEYGDSLSTLFQDAREHPDGDRRTGEVGKHQKGCEGGGGSG